MAALVERPDSPARIIADVMRAGGFMLVLPFGIYAMPARIVVPFAERIEAHKQALSEMLVSLARERD